MGQERTKREFGRTDLQSRLGADGSMSEFVDTTPRVKYRLDGEYGLARLMLLFSQFFVQSGFCC